MKLERGTADLHMHTTASDGKATVQELLQFVTLQRPYLDVIAITDHDTLESAWWALEHRHEYPFEIVPGMEVSTREGHVLALWVLQPIPKHMDLADTVAAIHAAGGIAILAHPFHVQLPIARENALRWWLEPQRLLDSGLDAIEAHNAANVIFGSNLAAGLFAQQQGFAVTGSSDAHTLGAIGSGVTRFAGRTAADLRQALLAKQTVAEGSTWHIREFIAYLQHARTRKAMQSSAKPA
jgi:hypothetical protein